MPALYETALPLARVPRVLHRSRTRIVAGESGSGSGPAELLARRFEAPVVFFGIGLPEDHWHDSDESDESADLDELLLAVGVLARLWVELAALCPRRARGATLLGSRRTLGRLDA